MRAKWKGKDMAGTSCDFLPLSGSLRPSDRTSDILAMKFLRRKGVSGNFGCFVDLSIPTARETALIPRANRRVRDVKRLGDRPQ